MSEILVGITSQSADDSEAGFTEVNDLVDTVVVGDAGSVVLLMAVVPLEDSGGIDDGADFRFAIDDVLVGPEVTAFKDGSTHACGVAICWAVTGLSGSTKFALQWRTRGAAAGTETSSVRSFQVIEITNASLLVDIASTSADSATSGYDDIDELTDTQTPASVDSVLLMLANLDGAMAGGDNSANFQFTVGGSAVGPESKAFEDDLDEGCGMSHLWMETGHSGPTAFACQWDETDPEFLTDTGRVRSFQVIEITAGAEILTAITSVASDTLTGSYTVVVDLEDTIDVVDTDSILLFSGMVPLPANGGNTAQFQFHEDSTGKGPEQFVRENSGDEGCGHSLYWVEDGFSTGSHTFSVQGNNHLGTVSISTAERRAFSILELTDAVAPVAAITGSITASTTEADLVAGGKVILITLTDDTWVAVGGAFDAIRQDIIDGLVSAQSEVDGWNSEIQTEMDMSEVVRTSDTLVTITIAGQAAYNITAQETITVTVPGSAVVGGSPIVAAPTFTVDPTTAEITGTVEPTTTENEIVAVGGDTIIITLANDIWAAAGAAFNAIRQDIIDGLDSAQSETFGWNAEVRDNMLVGAVVRTSDTVVTITLAIESEYTIHATETITVTVPASALVSSINTVIATPTFTVTPNTFIVISGGTIKAATTENDIRTGGKILTLTCQFTKWVEAGATFDAIRQDIIDGLDSDQSELLGWNNEVRDELLVGAVVRTTDRIVTITFPAFPNYDITATETVFANVPSTALLSAAPFTTGDWTVDVGPIAVDSGGSISPVSIESQIVSGVRTSILTLTEDTWVASGTAFNNARQAIIDGFDSAQSEAAGWNAEVRDKQAVGQCVRTSDTVVTISWSASPLYNITDNEVITVTVPAAAMVLSAIPVVATPTFTIFEVPIAIITGTITPTVPEVDVVAGGKTLIITLIDDEWLAAGVPFDDSRQEIIDGITASTTQSNGWNQDVRDNLNPSNVIRTSDTVVTITWVAVPTYEIVDNETVTVTVPGSALDQTSNDITGVPTFDTIATVVAGSKARDRRGGKHAEDIFDVNTPNVETFPVNKFD